jgi:transcriptional regulator with XRE-family HTH domain
MKRKEIRPEHQVLMTELGKRIKKLRTDKNIGYVQMSKEIGISKNAYNTIELGNVYFNFSTLLHIANYHGVSLSNLMNDL